MSNFSHFSTKRFLCDHSTIPIYDRPWRRFFRKTRIQLCVRCGGYWL